MIFHVLVNSVELFLCELFAILTQCLIEVHDELAIRTLIYLNFTKFLTHVEVRCLIFLSNDLVPLNSVQFSLKTDFL